MGASFIILVRLAGLEPAAYGLGIHRSIRLSYKRSTAKHTPSGSMPEKYGVGKETRTPNIWIHSPVL
jgi:hypothetical protein